MSDIRFQTKAQSIWLSFFVFKGYTYPFNLIRIFHIFPHSKNKNDGNLKRHFLLVLLVLPLLFSGCLRTYYPLHNGISPTPLTFETEQNPDKTSKYIGVEYTTAKGYYENETVNIARGIFSTAHTTDHTNMNLEAFGFMGNYKVVDVSQAFDGNKTAFGLGGNFKLAFNFKVKKVKFGLGFSLGLQTEFGEYSDFTKNASDAGLISAKEPLAASFSLFPFLAFQLSKATILSLQVTIGYPVGISPSIMLNSSNISGWISFVPNTEDHTDFITNKFVFGMKYRL